MLPYPDHIPTLGRVIDMHESVFARIINLISNGFEVRIRPDVMDGRIEIRLTKNHHTVARVVDPAACRQSYAFESDEHWVLYILNTLEFQYIDYVRSVERGLP